MSDIPVSPFPIRISRTTILLVLCATILSICTGLRQSFGLFLPPMATLGISASAFGFAIALQAIVWGISQPLIGMLADRYGTRPIVVAAALVFATGFLVMGSASGAFALDIGAGLLVGVGIAGTGVGVVMGAVSRAVPRERRSQVVGAVAAAGSLGTFVLAPLGQWLIDGFGWRAALVAFAFVASAMALLAIGIGEASPRPQTVAAKAADQASLGAVLRAAATHPGYVAMTVAFFACGFQLMFITVHLPSYLATCGMPPGLAAGALGVIGVCNAFGTYAIGRLGAHYSQKRLLALLYLGRSLAIGAFITVPVSPASTLIFATAAGLLWLGVVPLVSGLVDKVFGLKHFGTLYGFAFLSHSLGSSCGALLGGVSFDLTGSYGVAWAGLIVIGLLAFVLQWSMDDRPPADIATAGVGSPRNAL